MIATVRLNDELEDTLNTIAKSLHKKKSDIIREAILFYAKSLQDSKKKRLHNAIDKTAKYDFDEYKNIEDTINDGI
jgi:predicted transcriptional regulator